MVGGSNEEMRRQILEKIASRMRGSFEMGEIARLTEGFSGSDLRMVVREAVLSALKEGRRELTQESLISAIQEFSRREGAKTGVLEEENIA